MYRYDEFDHDFVNQRVGQYRDQVERRLSGELEEDAFKPLRLMNGVYLQLHAYMLRVAIPYGTLNSTQMRRLARIARDYDKGYGHFTTRQNIQYNWPVRHPAIAYAMSRQTILPVPPLTKWPTRAPMLKSCANGRQTTRNIPSCRASSRLPSLVRSVTAPPSRCMISGCI